MLGLVFLQYHTLACFSERTREGVFVGRVSKETEEKGTLLGTQEKPSSLQARYRPLQPANVPACAPRPHDWGGGPHNSRQSPPSVLDPCPHCMRSAPHLL